MKDDFEGMWDDFIKEFYCNRRREGMKKDILIDLISKNLKGSIQQLNEALDMLPALDSLESWKEFLKLVDSAHKPICRLDALAERLVDDLERFTEYVKDMKPKHLSIVERDTKS